jgi:hypothetical protein
MIDTPSSNNISGLPGKSHMLNFLFYKRLSLHTGRPVGQKLE